MWCSKLHNGGRKGNVDGMDTADGNNKKKITSYLQKEIHM